MKKADFFDDQTTKSFAVGLKLFSEVMLENKDRDAAKLEQKRQELKKLKRGLEKLKVNFNYE